MDCPVKIKTNQLFWQGDVDERPAEDSLREGRQPENEVVPLGLNGQSEAG